MNRTSEPGTITRTEPRSWPFPPAVPGGPAASANGLLWPPDSSGGACPAPLRFALAPLRVRGGARLTGFLLVLAALLALPPQAQAQTDPAITIAADWPKATGKIDWVRYTLTREGDTAQPVTVPVTFEGFAGNDWNLDIDSREVTFGAGSRTATQAILLSSTGDNNIGFSLSATQSGTLTARLGAVTGYDTSDTDEVQVVVIDGPAWVIRLTETAYTFTEDGGGQTIVLEATAASADMPAPSLDAGNNSVLGASVTAEGGTARIVQDYAPLNSVKYFESLECSAGSGVQVCQAEVTFTPVDDDLVEPDETLTLELARLPGNSSAIHYQGPDGTVSPTIKVYPATITDDESAGQRANIPPTAANNAVTTNEDTPYTFTAADFKFSDDDTGDALASVTVVMLPAVGALALDESSVMVGQSVPAADIGGLVFTPDANANGTGYATFSFKVSDGDDESVSAYTMTVNVTAVNDPATGAPTISGTAQEGQTLTATTAGIADLDGLTSPNYLYRWVRVDADGTSNPTDITGATSATYMPVAADVGKRLKVEVSFTDDASNGEERTSDAYPASETVNAAPNAAPSFTSSATFNAPENQVAVGTVQASDSDSGDSVTGYAIQRGADQSKFSIVAATGVLTFASAPNFENPTDADTGNDYVVVVRATSGADGRVKTADQTITVTVTDVDGEVPGVPVAPLVSSASLTSLNVSWAAPTNAGPAITDYDLQYRIGDSGNFTAGPQDVAGTSATITGLAENTEYEVQVRATNAEGTSGWSDPGSGSTDANAAPSFTSQATFDAAENQTAVGTVQASDSDSGDSVTGYAIQGGADPSKFSIVAATGVLTFASAPNFENPTDTDTGNDYVVVVRATSGAGARAKTADQTITVTVTDVDGEAPGVPVAPLVSSASLTSLNVSWAAPTNAGPAITGYDLQYRVGDSGNFTAGPQDVAGTSATITGLAENTEYEVQVRATNAEGTSGWSDSGTIANAPENLQATAGNAEVTLTWDAPNNDSGADITGYAYRYKESGGDFIAYRDIPDSGPGEANARSYTVAELTNGLEYVFHVRAVNERGGGLPAEVTVMLPGIVSSESEELPAEATLSANYPNPFNPETTIRYGLPKAGEVRLAVYNLLGHEVAILVDRSKPAGIHTVRFGAGNLPSGVYVYRLQAQGKTIVRTMMLVK